MSIIASLQSSGRFEEKYTKAEDFVTPAQEKIPAEEKSTPEYCLSIARSAFSALMRNKNTTPVGYYSYIQVLRDYLTGSQDEEYYLNLLKNVDPQTTSQSGTVQSDLFSKKSQMDGYEHLSTKIVSSMPAIRQAIQGLFSDYDEYAFVTTVDQEAGQIEDQDVAEAMADIFLKPMMDAANQAGVPLGNEAKFPSDTTMDEMLIYKDMGGFKAKWAEGLEQLIFFTQKQSGWDDHIKRSFIDDYLATGWIMAREVYNKEKDISEWEYVDIANATIQYSNDKLFRDAEYGGYFQLEKISKLVALGFDSDQLKKAAKTYGGMFDNSSYIETYNSSPTEVVPNRILDFRIPVYHHYWIETDVKKTLKVKNEFGEKNFDVGLNEEIKPVDKHRAKKGVSQEQRTTRIRRTYGCSWVVDTDMIYDYGIIPNQARKSKKDPKLPLFAYKEVATNSNKMFGSIVENVIPFLDRQQILWLKYQNALLQAHPGGYMINYRLLQNLEIAGKGIDPLEAFDMFWKYGRGIYMDTAIDGRYEGGAVLPISQIPGNYGELLAVLSQEIEYIKGQIRDYTGIDTTTVGVASEGNTATEVAMTKQGTNNILRPMTKAIFSLKQELANYSARKIQLYVRNIEESYRVYSNIVGADVTDILKKMERDGNEYGMTLEVKPSDMEVQAVMDAANAAMNVGRDGDSQIDLGDWMYIKERILNGGNLKKLTRDIAFRVKKKEERDQAMTTQNIMTQKEQDAKTAQMLAQEKQKEAMMEHQMEMELESKKTEGQLMIDKNKSDLELKNKIAELALGADTEDKNDKRI